VEPGQITQYAIRIYPIAHRLAAGHCLRLEIKSIEDLGAVDLMLPPESSHLNSARATTHKIYRDQEWQSHLVLPVIP
jgi:predicted acyl esterase